MRIFHCNLMEAKQSAAHTGCFFWSWILIHEVWPLPPNKPETEPLSSHAGGKICSETLTDLHELLLNYSSGSFYLQENTSGYYFKCITSEEGRIFGPCRVEAHSRCWATLMFSVPNTGAFKRREQCGCCQGKACVRLMLTGGWEAPKCPMSRSALCGRRQLQVSEPKTKCLLCELVSGDKWSSVCSSVGMHASYN